MTRLLNLILLLLPVTILAQNAVISPAKMNVVYMGIDNPLQAMAKDCPCDRLVLKTDNGNIIPDSCGLYRFLPGRPGSVAIVKAYCVRRPGDSLLVGETPFRVRTIPNPTPEFNVRVSGHFANPGGVRGVIAVSHGFEFDAPFKITSLKFTLKRRNGETVSEICNSGLFNGKILALLESAKHGDRVEVDDVMAIGPDNIPRNIGSLTFRF